VSALSAERELTLAEAASAMNVPVRTLRRWIARWLDAGIDGIRREHSRGGHRGERYVVRESFVARWRRCEVPTPHASAA
jgi:predicted DNA-binding transcriptional regulator YafY